MCEKGHLEIDSTVMAEARTIVRQRMGSRRKLEDEDFQELTMLIATRYQVAKETYNRQEMRWVHTLHPGFTIVVSRRLQSKGAHACLKIWISIFSIPKTPTLTFVRFIKTLIELRNNQLSSWFAFCLVYYIMVCLYSGWLHLKQGTNDWWKITSGNFASR